MNYSDQDLQLFELVVEEDGDGVFANSFVEEPAIERDFVFFNKHKEVTFQAIDTEKRLVAGPLLIPNKKIIRMDEQMGMYNVFFKPETIETIARKFMKNKYNGEVTTEHDKNFFTFSTAFSECPPICQLYSPRGTCETFQQ